LCGKGNVDTVLHCVGKGMVRLYCIVWEREW